MPDSRYKTKLCMLYQRGNCHRNSCNFAHGEDDLRTPGRSTHYRSFSRRSPEKRYEQRGRSYDRDSRSYSPATQQPSKSLSSPRSGQKRSGSNIEGEAEGKRFCKGEHQSELSEVRAAHGEAQSDVKEVQSEFLTEKLRKAEADLEKLDSQKLMMQKDFDNALQEIQRLKTKLEDGKAKLEDGKAKLIRLESSKKMLDKFLKGYTYIERCEDDLKRAKQKLTEEIAEYRMSMDSLYETDRAWKGRASNGPVANGLDSKSRKSAFDDRDIADNASDGQDFLETGFCKP